MSTQRVKYIKQFFPIESYTYDSANTRAVIVANTVYTNLLYTGLPIYLCSNIQYSNFKTVANNVVANSNTFTSSVSAVNYIQNMSHIGVDGYLPGQTGPQAEQTLPRGTGCDTVVQSFVNGTGGASYNLELSLDTTHWINFASVTHGSDNGNTVATFIAPGWAYMRANLSSVGANTNLVIMSSE